MSNLGVKVDEIKTRIKKNKVQGLIFISQKFCDNTLLFYPLLRQYLNDIKVPSLFLEIEHNNLSFGQIKTRIQAFIEII
jgi:benzoyl-CoA reductase/2-hydroxyglutaryl-CoA dehydratase subunit BcrC/BadD/HgdB